MEELRRLLLERGASVVGFADLGELPEGCRQGFRYGVVIGVALDRRIIASIEKGPNEEYVQLYHRMNALLDKLTKTGVEFLTGRGYRAVAQPATSRTASESEDLATVLPHKTVATRAGLGWIGKNALLVTKEFGTAVRLATILTDAPVEAGSPVNESQCGTCIECVKICPGQAPSGVNWKVGMSREEFFDARACRQTSRNRPDNAHLSRRLCGVCIPACPHTRRYLKNLGAF